MISGPCWVQVEPERANIHASPPPSPLPAPISARFPSAESATLPPPPENSPSSVSASPCWVQVDPERVNTQATLPSSPLPPISAVSPVAESAMLQPNSPLLPRPVSGGPSWVHVEPERL